jgi:uncharacterized membrane protein
MRCQRNRKVEFNNGTTHLGTHRFLDIVLLAPFLVLGIMAERALRMQLAEQSGLPDNI